MNPTIEQLVTRIEQLENKFKQFENAAQLDPQIVRTMREVIGGINLEDLDNVNISSPTSGQVLKYNGTEWINDTDEVV